MGDGNRERLGLEARNVHDKVESRGRAGCEMTGSRGTGTRGIEVSIVGLIADERGSTIKKSHLRHGSARGDCAVSPGR